MGRRASKAQWPEILVRPAGTDHLTARSLKENCQRQGLPMGLFTKDIESMDDLLVHGLQDIYYAENQIIKSLPKLIDKADKSRSEQGPFGPSRRD